MGRVKGDGIALLHDLDDCTGCFGCESACRETHRYPYSEDWMKTERRKPFMVDGKLRQYHHVSPVLDKCAQCVSENPVPLCVSGCSAGALFVGTLDQMVEMAMDRHCTIFYAS